ncbi:ribosome maturation factor RimM [Megamonas hypermegale]|uniref:ribosome maturation factor RimM n=1 Tax=Megamonas hypermegale TaxID=158847 RepID=UPI001957758B|nr:ribosome maturation factor RimM [Megamonas hypermegale]MBM6760546.1 16S rRNA processing protein RimM [Megamonas hypermegale]
MKSVTDKKIIIGKFGATHGIRGDIKVYPLTDFPERFNTIKTAYVDDKEIEISKTRYQKNFVVMKIKGIDNREDAMRFTNKLLKINRADAASLNEGEYYAFDIVGLNVINQDDVVLGEITDILKTGSNDVYIIKAKDGRQILIPALKKVVTEINIQDGYMKVIWDENQEV